METDFNHAVFSEAKNFGFYAKLNYTLSGNSLTVTDIIMKQDSNANSYGAYYALSQTGVLTIGDTRHEITSTNIARNTTTAYTAVSGSWSGSVSSGQSITVTWTYRGRSSDPNMLTHTWTFTPSYWNDINAYQPDNVTQNGLKFDLRLSDGSVWYDITNEPEGFTRPYGTVATISNIRPAIEGIHYTRCNIVEGDAPEPFSWTFTQQSFVCELFSEWNTYPIFYENNGGVGGPIVQTKTYNEDLTLSSEIPTKTGYTFLGWSLDENATEASYAAGSVLTENLTTDPSAIVILYAVWSINSYRLDLNGYLDGVENGDLSSYGTVDIEVNGVTVETDVNDYFGLLTYGSSYRIKNITANDGYQYNGVYSGNIEGTMGAERNNVVLNFSTKVPSSLNINGTVNSPFEISLNWSANGLNITNYIVYANGSIIYSGTDTSFVFNCAEDTTYNFYFSATNAGGTVNSDTIVLTSPADQAKARIKKDGRWEKGKVYYKKDGQWIKAKKLYIKKEGRWIMNIND